RMGQRRQLPLPPRTQPGAATLDRPLQPAKTPQLTRRQTTNQPRSQRPWVGLSRARSRIFRERPSLPLGIGMRTGDATGPRNGDELQANAPTLVRSLRKGFGWTDGRGRCGQRGIAATRRGWRRVLRVHPASTTLLTRYRRAVVTGPVFCTLQGALRRVGY